jgi:MFS family permease
MFSIVMASFSNDLVMPGAWTAAMDVGGKYAGTVSGAVNSWGNLGGALGPLVTAYILHWSHGNWNLPLYMSAAIYLMGVFCWLALDPVTPLDAGRAVGSNRDRPRG